MTLEEMQRRKKELGLTNEEIAARSGLSVPTVQRILSGTTKNPQGWNREFIEAVLMDGTDLSVKESTAFAYITKRQGEYTVDDYAKFPDEKRCEIIDGVIYDLASPTAMHQEIVGELFLQLKDHVRKNKGTCRVLTAPLDCALEKKTIVQPDVLVICDPDKRSPVGRPVPTFAAEVVSPSSVERDYLLKLGNYEKAGVREYWIIDYKNSKITVYVFGNDFDVQTYGFYDKIPVAIWDGECVIDFSILKEEIPLYQGLDEE